MSPAVGPEEPLCLVAKQPGWVPQQVGKVGQPTSQPMFTLTWLEVQKARPAQSQLATFHMLVQQLGADVPSSYSLWVCVSGAVSGVNKGDWHKQIAPLSGTWGAAAKIQFEGIKGKAEPGLLPEKLFKLKETEGSVLHNRSNLLVCSH